MVRIFVPDVPEFRPLLDAARRTADCCTLEPKKGYWRIEAEHEICFERRPLGLRPALWNSALTGGFSGRIIEYDRNIIRIANEIQD
jgi:hypothetical protein